MSFSTVFSVGLISGSLNSLVLKLAYQQEARDSEGNMTAFEKPWLMSWMMFAAMLVALPIFYLATRPEGKDRGSSWRIPPRLWAIVSVPSLCDLLGSSLQQMGLVLVPVSIYQMLKGSVLLFSAALSVIFLGRKLQLSHWVGVILCFVSLCMVGIAGIMTAQQSEGGEGNVWKNVLGIVFIVGGQLVCASQYVLEEFLLKPPNDAPPLALVGLEGFWGLIMMTFVVLPLCQYMPGSDVGGVYENTWDAVLKLEENPFLLSLCVLFILSVFIFNICGVLVTAYASAIHHTFLDASRTLVIWVASVMMHYLWKPEYGESLSGWSVLQLVGFVLLIAGQMIYDGLLRLPGVVEEEHLSPLLAPPCVNSPAYHKTRGEGEESRKMELSKGYVLISDEKVEKKL